MIEFRASTQLETERERGAKLERASDEQRGMATEPIPTARRLLLILRGSPMLQTLPLVRKCALRESVRMATSEEQVNEILLANLTGSPYIPDVIKGQLAELVLSRNWDSLASALQCPASVHTGVGLDLSTSTEYSLFQQMVVLIFSRSRRLQGLDASRRRQLGSLLHRCRSRDELITTTLAALENAQTLDAGEREQVANDILDSRFDLLLLPDRFDCDERPRNERSGRERAAPSSSVPTAQQQPRQRPPPPPPPEGHVGIYRPSQNASVSGGGGAGGGSGGGLPMGQSVEVEGLHAAVPVAVPMGLAISDENECPVCLGMCVAERRLPCSHTFCRECITQWAGSQPTFQCPLCRAEHPREHAYALQ